MMTSPPTSQITERVKDKPNTADACSGKVKMFDVIMETIDLDLPAFMGTLFSYAANPGLIIPAVLLMV